MTVEIAFAFPLPGGLHARPASRLQEEVSRFRSVVTFMNRASGAGASARSVLGLVAIQLQRARPTAVFGHQLRQWPAEHRRLRHPEHPLSCRIEKNDVA